MLKKIAAFLFGVREFRASITTHVDEPLAHSYDLGREWAHRLTLRYWDQSGVNMWRWPSLLFSARKRNSVVPDPGFGGYAESIITDPADYDALEVHGVSTEEDGDGTTHCEVNDESPEFYSVCAHLVQGGVECIGDFATEADANEYANKIAGRFNWPVDRRVVAGGTI